MIVLLPGLYVLVLFEKLSSNTMAGAALRALPEPRRGQGEFLKICS
jgi:hypothetical protein